MIDLTPFLSGMVGGACHAIVSHPFDLIKVRLQSNFGYKTTAHAATEIWRADGIRGFYRGFAPVILGAAPVMGVCIASLTQAKKIIAILCGNDVQRDSLALWQVAIAGSLASIPTGLVLAPAERLKILLQVQQSPLNGRSSPVESLRSFIKMFKGAGGARYFFQGTVLTIARDIPGDASYFATFEGVKRVLNRNEAGTPKQFNPIPTIIAGGLAGCANWIVCIPIDAVKTQFQQLKPGERKTIYGLFKEQSVSKLYRGLGPALLRAFPSSGAFFLGVEGATFLFNTK